MKKLAYLGAAGALGAAALLSGGRLGHAADHGDAPLTQANKMADINDVYAWMTGDGASVNLVMTVDPLEMPGTPVNSFGPSIQYVFHVTSLPGFLMPGTETKVICTFASNTSAQCWVAHGTTTIDYVKGDPSSTAGITSASTKMKLFAGLRSDPFFFNLGGFKRAQMTVESAAGGLMFDKAKCPVIDFQTAAQLRIMLQSPPPAPVAPCPMGVANCFASYNVLAIVLQIDKTELNMGSNTLLSVWGSTHMAM